MKIIKKYNIFVVALFVFTLLTACQRTELCYDHYPTASLNFSWERVWERDYGMDHLSNWDKDYHGFDYDYLRPGSPEWVNLVIYNNDDSEAEHYFSPEGGKLVLEENNDYSFLLYNGDTEYIILSDIAWLPGVRASATPRSRSSIKHIMERHPGVKAANPPDVLYAGFIDRIPAIKNHEVKELPIVMKPLVYTYVIRYEFEYGLEHVALARGALGGMAESVYLRDGRTSDESIIILYDCEIKDYGCEAYVRSFGVPGFPDEYYRRSEPEDPERPYTLNLELLLTNGKTLEFNYDVAEQLKNQPRGGVIVIPGIRIEDEQNQSEMSSGSFDVDLSGWYEEDVDLPINNTTNPNNRRNSYSK